jgi:thiamine kinase-like enzyme
MVRNRDLINRSLVALESKLESLRNHVVKRFPIEGFIQLTEQCKKNVQTVKSNVMLTRNNDILARELATLEKNIIFLREAVDGQHPVERFLKTIESAEQALEAIDQAVQREPLDGYELSDPRRVN